MGGPERRCRCSMHGHTHQALHCLDIVVELGSLLYVVRHFVMWSRCRRCFAKIWAFFSATIRLLSQMYPKKHRLDIVVELGSLLYVVRHVIVCSRWRSCRQGLAKSGKRISSSRRTLYPSALWGHRPYHALPRHRRRVEFSVAWGYRRRCRRGLVK